MEWFYLANGFILCGGILAFIFPFTLRGLNNPNRSHSSNAVRVTIINRSNWVGSIGIVLGSAVGLWFSLMVILGDVVYESQFLSTIPWLAIHIRVDGLSAWFMIPVYLIGGLASIYGKGYISLYFPSPMDTPATNTSATSTDIEALLLEKDDIPGTPSVKSSKRHHHSPPTPKAVGASWLFFSILIGSMSLVTSAWNGFLFLIVWEIMSLSSFLLVLFDHKNEEALHAGWLYFISTHIGTAFLVVMFLLLGNAYTSFDFSEYTNSQVLQPISGFLFVLAIIGFGTKAGFMPFHVWLPFAHPAAPSHVSAIMSGVMIKMGIYGLLRITWLIGPPEPWWGLTMIGMGCVSGLFGILFALNQRDIKRFLAYSSIENIGIIALGIGCGMLGQSTNIPWLMVLGYAGALLHVLNHALFKSSLFFGAGIIVQQTHTRDIHEMGGFLKQVPFSGWLFLIGSIAICGLPPLNGFISEWFLYLAGYYGILESSGIHLLGLIGVILWLAFIGSLALAGFTNVFGMIFLGNNRSGLHYSLKDNDAFLRIPFAILILLSIALGLASFLIVDPLTKPIITLTHVEKALIVDMLKPIQMDVFYLGLSLIGFILLIVILYRVKKRLQAKKSVSSAGTWDCGFIAPTAQMQYTSTSFVDPFAQFYKNLLSIRRIGVQDASIFPKKWIHRTYFSDWFLNSIYDTAFRWIRMVLSKLRWMQSGQTHKYVAYIVLILLILILLMYFHII